MRTDGIFIGVEVDDAVAGDAALAAKLAEVCPVDIYAQSTHGHAASSRRTSTSACSAACASTRRRRARSRCSSSTTPAPRCSASEAAAQNWRVRHAPTGRLVRMPELPEVERARQAIERGALHRRIAAVDDSDSYVCRPHAPGEIADALVGRELTAAHRRGKAMWVETSDDGPVLGLHLGMAGRIVVDEEPAPRRLGSLHRALRGRRHAGAARQAPPRPRAPGARPRRRRARRRRDRARRVPRARRPRHRAAEGAAHGPGRRRRRGQPARRRDPLARAAGSAAPGRRAEHRRARPPAPRAARRDALGDAPRRRAHRRRHRRAAARAALPALRHRDGARDRRRPHDLLVPAEQR